MIDLLKKILSELDADRDKYGHICDEIEAELAKSEPHPIGEVVESGGTLATVSTSGFEGVNIPTGTKLYTSQLQQKTLSDECLSRIRLKNNFTRICLEDFIMYSRAIEKALGIGSDNG